MEFIFQSASVLLYLWISGLLLYHQLLKRWFGFSLGYVLVYGLASYVFFSKVVLPVSIQHALGALPPFLFFFLFFVAIGFSLYMELNAVQTLGLLILSALILGALASSESLKNGFFQSLGDHEKAGVEIASVVLVLLGLMVVVGFALLTGWTGKQVFGAAIIFLGFSGCIMAVIYFSIGYDTLIPLLESKAKALFQAVNDWKDR